MLLAATKDANLETVKKLFKQDGFTAKQLRGCLATKDKKTTITTNGRNRKTKVK
jgi:hypothetical protein